MQADILPFAIIRAIYSLFEDEHTMFNIYSFDFHLEKGNVILRLYGFVTGESAQKNERGHYHFFRVVPEQYPLQLYEEPKLAYQHC